MKQIILIGYLLFIGIDYSQTKGIITDSRDGKVYKTVNIGTQTWMTENLNVATFRNGDPIPEAKSQEDWNKAQKEKKPAWCYYDFNPENGNFHGKIYNCYSVIDPRGLAPEGYKIPELIDWRILEKNVNNLFYSNITYDTGSIIDQKLMSKEYWIENKNGTNETGFNALPSGYHEGTSFNEIGEIAFFWCLDQRLDGVYMRRYSQESAGIIQTGSCHDGFEGDGFSVRCLLEKPFIFNKKEKKRLRKNKYFSGMVYVDTMQANYFKGYRLGKPLEEDSTYYYSRGQLKKDLDPFYISDHEVTNGEYREFINWVRDSIARVKLFNRSTTDEKLKWGTNVDYNSGNKDTDEKYFKLNWESKIDFKDEKIYRLLKDMFVNSDERYYHRKEIDVRFLLYDYTDEEGFFNRINVYPDTLPIMSSMSDNYFWHPAYNEYPVVGITFSQAKAYCIWRTQMYLKEMNNSRNRRQQGIRFRLPNEHEWMLASRGYEMMNDASYHYITEGWRRNKDGSYNSNFGISILRSGIVDKYHYNDGGFYTEKVKSYKTNSNGIYCMFGNVSEWVDEIPKEQDFFGDFLTFIELDAISFFKRLESNETNNVYITDPYSDSTFFVEKLSKEHREIINRRLAFYRVYPNDSYETVKTKYYQLHTIQKEFESKVNDLITNNIEKSKPSNCELHGLKLYNFITGEFFHENCIGNSNEFDVRVYPLFQKFQHNDNVIKRATKVIISSRENPTEDCRLVKGGSWDDEPHYLLIENAQVYRTSESSSKIGFRVVCDASEQDLTKKERKRLSEVRKLKIY